MINFVSLSNKKVYTHMVNLPIEYSDKKSDSFWWNEFDETFC